MKDWQKRLNKDWKDRLRKLKEVMVRDKKEEAEEEMSNRLKEKLKDGKKHKVKTTGMSRLYVDGAKVYESRSLEKVDSFFYGMFVGCAITMAAWTIAILYAVRRL